MATINLSSSSVEVFPSTQRAAGNSDYKYSRVLSEKWLISLINQLTDRDAFVISNDNNHLIFNMLGYYFDIDTTGIQMPSNAYAKITVGPLSGTDTPVLHGADADSVYAGLSITDAYAGTAMSTPGLYKEATDTTGVFNYYYLIMSSGTVPEEDFIKFLADNIAGTFDCGSLD